MTHEQAKKVYPLQIGRCSGTILSQGTELEKNKLGSLILKINDSEIGRGRIT